MGETKKRDFFKSAFLSFGVRMWGGGLVARTARLFFAAPGRSNWACRSPKTLGGVKRFFLQGLSVLESFFGPCRLFRGVESVDPALVSDLFLILNGNFVGESAFLIVGTWCGGGRTACTGPRSSPKIALLKLVFGEGTTCPVNSPLAHESNTLFMRACSVLFASGARKKGQSIVDHELFPPLLCCGGLSWEDPSPDGLSMLLLFLLPGPGGCVLLEDTLPLQ